MTTSASYRPSITERAHDRPVNVYPATGTGALSLVTTERGRFRLVQATIRFSAIPTTSQDATLQLDASDGANYDSILRRVNPSVGTGNGDVVFTGGDEDIYEAGDQLTLAFTNTDARTIGARIVVEPM